jgi:hypothetical protein
MGLALFAAADLEFEAFHNFSCLSSPSDAMPRYFLRPVLILRTTPFVPDATGAPVLA